MLCRSRLAATRSLVCSSAVFRGAGRGTEDDELLLLVVGPAAGSTVSLTGAGSASVLSGSGALGGIFPTLSFDSATSRNSAYVSCRFFTKSSEVPHLWNSAFSAGESVSLFMSALSL